MAKIQPPITKERLERIRTLNKKFEEEEAEREEAFEDAHNPGRSIFTREDNKQATSQQNPLITALELLEEEEKISAALRSQTVPEINCDISIPDEGELLQAPKSFIQLDQKNVGLSVSAMGHYLIAFPADGVTVYLYKWHALIYKSNVCGLKFKVPSKSPIANFGFLLNDTYIQFDFYDGTTTQYIIKDSKKDALLEPEQIENKLSLQEDPFILASEDTYPSSGKVMTSCKRFTPLTAWLVKDDRNILPPQGYKLKAKPCGIRLLRHYSSKAIILHIPHVGILYKINNLDIMKWKLLIGNPMVICLYTADSVCHVVIAQTNTLIPVVSDVSTVIRGPQDYLIVCEKGTWSVIKLSESISEQIPSPTSSTSTSEPNSPSESPTPSSPASPSSSCTPSASTSSATTSCAPSTQSYIGSLSKLSISGTPHNLESGWLRKSSISSDNRIA